MRPPNTLRCKPTRVHMRANVIGQLWHVNVPRTTEPGPNVSRIIPGDLTAGQIITRLSKLYFSLLGR